IFPYMGAPWLPSLQFITAYVNKDCTRAPEPRRRAISAPDAMSWPGSQLFLDAHGARGCRVLPQPRSGLFAVIRGATNAVSATHFNSHDPGFTFVEYDNDPAFG